MSENRIKKRWVEWNLLGKGKDHSPLYHAKYAYRGLVLYAHAEPIARLVRTPKGNFACLYKHMGYIDVGKLERQWPVDARRPSAPTSTSRTSECSPSTPTT